MTSDRTKPDLSRMLTPDDMTGWIAMLARAKPNDIPRHVARLESCRRLEIISPSQQGIIERAIAGRSTPRTTR